MGRLSSKERNSLPEEDFAGPSRSFPDEDLSHARNALSRVAQSDHEDIRAKVRAKVYAKYPELKD
jgi:hypothetical protein